MCNVSSNLYVASELIAAFVYKILSSRRIFILTCEDNSEKKNKIESKFRKLIVVEVPHMKLEMVLRERVVLWSMGICHKEV